MAENSAKSYSLKMGLLDLTDDALIHVFSYLDHYSQLEAMLVCRRFELLIGQHAQFYSKYTLKIKRQDTKLKHPNYAKIMKFEKRTERFLYFGRYFGEVCLDDYYFSPGSKFFPSLMQTFEIIGPKIIKLGIIKSEGYKMPFLDVLRHVNNVRELSIQDVKLKSFPISMKYKEVDLQQFTFPNLKSLELNSIPYFEIFEEVFHPVASLQHLKLAKIDQKDWEMFQQLLIRQEDLRSLELNQVVVDNFEWRNWDMDNQKLTMRGVRFPKKEAFQSFTNFIKTLSNIQELRLDVTRDERENQNNYTEILTHLLNLPSLRVLKLKCANELNLRIRNPAVRSIIVDDSSISITTAAHFFPNIQRVECNSILSNSEDLRALTLLKSLTELKFHSMYQEQLLLIKCSQLQKFTVNQLYFFKFSIWKTFGENNPNIEFLELWHQEHLVRPLKYHPNLKSLKLLNFRLKNSTLPEKTLKYVAKKFIKGNLEHLEIGLNYLSPVAIVKYFKSKFHQIRCDYKIKSEKDCWLITIRKYI